MDDAALQEFQMHGQDIPWLLDHWAEHRPDHPVLVWDPPNGVGREWTYAQLREDTRRLAAGLVARGIVKGDKVLVHADNCPELVLAWLACATVGAVGVTTNTKSVGAELTYFIDKARCVAAITQPKFAAMVVEAGPALQWVAVTADDSGEPAAADLSGLTLDAFDDLFGDESAWPGRAAEPPRERRTSPRRSCTRTRTPCGPAGWGRATSTWDRTTATSSICRSSTSTPRVGRSSRCWVSAPPSS
jgi:crotonobetaine/carnitine-CoA ligase